MPRRLSSFDGKSEESEPHVEDGNLGEKVRGSGCE